MPPISNTVLYPIRPACPGASPELLPSHPLRIFHSHPHHRPQPIPVLFPSPLWLDWDNWTTVASNALSTAARSSAGAKRDTQSHSLITALLFAAALCLPIAPGYTSKLQHQFSRHYIQQQPCDRTRRPSGALQTSPWLPARASSPTSFRPPPVRYNLKTHLESRSYLHSRGRRLCFSRASRRVLVLAVATSDTAVRPAVAQSLDSIS